MPVLRPHVIQVLKELRIRNGLPNAHSPLYNSKRKSGTAASVDYLGDIVDQLPMNQLRAFA